MFGSRITIFKLCGINIGIDLSWLIIAILLSWTLAVGYFPSYYPGLSVGTYWLMGICGMLGLFICILLHELGHALVALHYKLPISQITLFIFGGVAEIEKAPPSPKVEFLVSIAGPIVSIVLAAALYGITLLGSTLHFPVEVVATTSYLALINLIIVLFNLLPAFPLDGGRVLLAILWNWKKNLGWATRVVTALGMGFGLFLLFSGLFLFLLGDLVGGIWFMILGLFLRAAATTSRTQFYIGQEFSKEKVGRFMTKNPICVDPSCTIKEFVDHYINETHHHLYPVMEDVRFLGYISLKEVKMVPHEAWEKTKIGSVMVPRGAVQMVRPDTKVLDALALLDKTSAYSLLVVEDDTLIGIVTSHTLFKLISLKLELEE